MVRHEYHSLLFVIVYYIGSLFWGVFYVLLSLLGMLLSLAQLNI